MVASRPHKAEVAGSNPASAPNTYEIFFFAVELNMEVWKSFW